MTIQPTHSARYRKVTRLILVLVAACVALLAVTEPASADGTTKPKPTAPHHKQHTPKPTPKPCKPPVKAPPIVVPPVVTPPAVVPPVVTPPVVAPPVVTPAPVVEAPVTSSIVTITNPVQEIDIEAPLNEVPDKPTFTGVTRNKRVRAAD